MKYVVEMPILMCEVEVDADDAEEAIENAMESFAEYARDRANYTAEPVEA